MNNESMRVAIAKELGWKCWQDEESGIIGGDWSKFIWTPPGKPDLAEAVTEPPNYPLSLDACAEFEKGLTKEEKTKYTWSLWLTTADMRDCWTETDYKMVYDFGHFDMESVVFATALQRCEAFLRVKSLWVEGEGK